MSCEATPAHASEPFEWRIRQRSHARPAVQRGGSGEELLYLYKVFLPVVISVCLIKRNIRLHFYLCFSLLPEGFKLCRRVIVQRLCRKLFHFAEAGHKFFI